MSQRTVIGVSDDVLVSTESINLTLHTQENPIVLAIPLAVAEGLLLTLRKAADDAHRMRIEDGDALRQAIVSIDRPPLDTVGCMANVAQDGRILLQFRHAAAATTAVFVPRLGAAMLAKALTDLGGQLQQRRGDDAKAEPPAVKGTKATREA